MWMLHTYEPWADKSIVKWLINDASPHKSLHLSTHDGKSNFLILKKYQYLFQLWYLGEILFEKEK